MGIIERVGRVGYNGKPQSPEWSAYDPACITVKGETQGTEIGTYEAILSLNSDDYCWPDKSLDDKTVTWTIGKGIVNIPTVTGTSRVYNGAEQGPAISSYDSSIVSVTGNKETDAGAYTVTIFLKDATHYEWNDHTTENKKTSWTIKHKLIAVPSQKGMLVYTGKKQAPEWNDYNENELVIGGTTSSTTSGTYKATFTPESNYEWADGGTETKEVEWTLGKADGDLSLDKSAIMLSKAEATDTFVVTRVGNGKISVASSDESVATVSLSGATATVTAKSEGSAIITISVAEGTNHKAPEDKTIYVNCDF